MKHFLIVCTFLVISTCRKLPTGFKRCDIKRSDFNECLTYTVPEAIRQMKVPIRSLGLPSLDPLEIPAISITPGPGIMSFQQNYTNLKVSGFTKISCSRVELNVEAKTMRMNCSSPQIKIDTDYVFNGSISVLPIYGNGTGKIVLDKTRCFHSFSIAEYLKKGKRHLRVLNSTLDIKPEKITYRFDNLYDGDKTLGENVNYVMNDNWREIFEGLKPLYEEAFTIVFADLFNRVFSRVPTSEIFING